MRKKQQSCGVLFQRIAKLKTNLKTEVYKVGCLGKITYFNETSDKRFLISLSGIVRFRIIKELVTNKLYREFKVDYSDFMHDLDNQKIRKEQYDVEDLFNQIKLYFKSKDVLWRRSFNCFFCFLFYYWVFV